MYQNVISYAVHVRISTLRNIVGPMLRRSRGEHSIYQFVSSYAVRVRISTSEIL